MKVQKGIVPESNRQCWIVLDDDYLPVEPIQKYLNYLDNLERSPNTISAYAHDLKLYWEFLQDKQFDWKTINMEHLADFIHWLRNPNKSVISIQPQASGRCDSTINHCLTVVCGFYEFHEHLGILEEGINTHRLHRPIHLGGKYKPFLHHISKGKEVKTKLHSRRSSSSLESALEQFT